jgi:hypothetical protein
MMATSIASLGIYPSEVLDFVVYRAWIALDLLSRRFKYGAVALLLPEISEEPA